MAYYKCGFIFVALTIISISKDNTVFTKLIFGIREHGGIAMNVFFFFLFNIVFWDLRTYFGQYSFIIIAGNGGEIYEK